MGHYQKDLQAQFTLERGTLREMQTLNIRQVEGTRSTLFQHYSRPFARGLFFEGFHFLDGHDGHGSLPRTPYRIAR